MNVSQAAVSKWTNGALPDSLKLIEIAGYFDVPVESLIRLKDGPKHAASAGKLETYSVREVTDNRNEYITGKIKKSDMVLALHKLEEFHASLASATKALGEIINIFRRNGD